MALILVDARKGASEQTCRHAFIASLLGIPHVVFCINKMDLVDHDEAAFERIKRQLEDFTSRLEVRDVRYIPISALKGDNVVDRSTRMDWYQGPTLMYLLENLHIAGDLNHIDRRFPVQYVVRPLTVEHHDFRGYAGRIAGGVFRKGDAATGMYVVVYGEIKLISTTPARGARLSGIVGPGQSFGEPVMFLERPALVDAQAASDALLLHLPKAVVFEEIERNPKFARRVIAGLSLRVESLVRELGRQALGSGSERFVAYLLRHGRGQPGPFVVTLPVAKAEIASQLNLTPEHFSRLLHELAQTGLLQVAGRKITVPDAQRLEGAARRR